MILSTINLAAQSTNSNHVLRNVTTAQLAQLTNLVVGELVYVTDGTPGIYSYNGSNWVQSNINANYQTSAQVITLADTEITNKKGIASGICELDANQKIPSTRLPDSILGALEYQGPRDMSVTLPIASSSNKGWYYIASNATIANGYNKGDWAVSNGTSWDKVDNTSTVSSVSGRTGAIVLSAADVGLVNLTNDKQLKDSQTLALTGDVVATSTALNTGSISVLVKKLNGKPLSNTAPTNGQSLTYNSSTGELSWSTITSGTMNASGLTGTLSNSVLPAFTGDVTSTQGFNILTLAPSGVVAGQYKSVSVDSKGRVTSGSNPTTISGFGITDAYSKTEVDAKNSLKLDISKADSINGYAKVQSNGQISGALIPAVPITNTVVANTTTDYSTLLAAATAGTVIVNNVTGQSMIKLADGTAVPLNTPTDTVSSINGRKGIISKINLADTSGIVDSNNLLQPSLFPALTGDITNTGLSTSLSATGVAAGEYSTVTVDTKGRVISGKSGVSYTKAEADAISNLKLNISNHDIINGYPLIQTDGKISGSVIPVVPISNTTVANTSAEVTLQIANANTGDVIVNNVTGQSLIKLADGTAVPLTTPTDTVSSINGRKGIIGKINLADTSGIVGANNQLDISLFPTLTGDITNTGFITNLSTTGVTAGEYSAVTVDTKGRVISGRTGVSYTKAEADSFYNLKLDISKSDIPFGYAKVQSGGQLSGALIPVVPISNTTVANTIADVNAQIAAAKAGDVIVNNVTGQSLIKLADGSTVPLNTPTDTVTSINGRKGQISKINLADTSGITDINNKLDPSLFPTLTGDITNIGLSTSLTTTGVAAGEYSTVTVDSKGRVISGKTGVSYTKTETDAIANLKVNVSNSDVPFGYAKVQSDGKVLGSLIPVVPISNTTVANTTADVTAQIAAANTGDVIINNVTGQSLIKLADGTAVPLTTPTDTVTSINGRKGIISKIALADTTGIVDNTNKLDPTLFPVLTGDITNTGLTTSLSATGVLAGQYNTVTVDSKGRVTAASNKTYGSANASDLNSGTLSASLLPALTGDVASAIGSNNVTVNKIKNYSITGTAANKKVLVFNSSASTLDWSNINYADVTNTPVNLSSFTNDSGYQTSAQVSTLANAAITAQKGIANGLCDLDVNQKVPLTKLPDSILGSLSYQGVRNMTTALPAATTANKGWYYITSVAGNGYVVNDWAVSNGVSWDKINNTSSVSSVAGRSGVVTLTNADVGLSNVTNDKQLKDTQTLAVTGDVTTSSPTLLNTGTIALTLNATGVTAGTYNSITVNSKGLVTAASVVSSGSTNASDLTTGTLNIARLPAFTGEVTSAIGTGALTLSTTGIAAGTYKSVTVDTKGRVTSGSNPTTLSGFGITDGVSLTGTNTFTNNVTAPAFVSTIATGTAPFTVTSTTAVPNLNVSKLNGVDISGTPAAGLVLLASSATAASWQTPPAAQATGNTAAVANSVAQRDANADLYANNFYSTSDLNKKANIQDLYISVIDQLQPKTFNFIDDTTETLRYGFIAQDLEPILPSVVSTNENGDKSVNYLDFIAILTKEIQSLKATVNVLSNRINELEK